MMKIRNDKEIIIGKTRDDIFAKSREVPFFVKDIKQLCFNPFESDIYKYSVIIKTPLSDDNETIFITKEKYEYLLEKLGVNEDDDE